MTATTTAQQPPAATALDRIGETTTLAVSYLRVSTKEQASKGGRDEGFSIPAQREANLRKARELNAIITEEFVDAGESARKADRPELMRMIEYVKTHQVAYCIVHKVDRLARNRADDVTIHLALKDAGVTLVSATENIDETPEGQVLLSGVSRLCRVPRGRVGCQAASAAWPGSSVMVSLTCRAACSAAAFAAASASIVSVAVSDSRLM